MDSTKIWYQSTVVSKFTKTELDNNEYVILKIGFRTFHPEGDKYDSEGRNYYGWSEAMDEYINAFSPRIQKYASQAKTFEESRAQIGNKVEET
jgi:hypothetical protein